MLESDVDRIADLGRGEPLDAGDEPARPGRPQAGEPLGVEAVRAAPEQGKGAVGEAANPEGGRLGNRRERRELRRGARHGALDRGEELQLRDLRLLHLGHTVLAPVDAQEDARALPLELDRLARLEVGLEAIEDPADRRLRVARRRRVDGSGHDQSVDRPGHRHVVEAARLGLVRRALRSPKLVEARGGVALPGRGVDDLEADPPVRQAQDLVAHGVLGVPPRVGDDHDLELEALRRVNGQEPHRIAALFLRDSLALARAGGLLVGDEAEEAFDVGTAELLVGARKPRELAEVRVAAAAVPPGEDREVVVVLGDDPLAEAFETRIGRGPHQPVVPLAEGLEETPVTRADLGREVAFHPAEERALAGRAAQEVERVVRDAHERRGEDAHQGLVVVAVEDEPEVHLQVADLLLPEVAAPRRAVRGQAFDPQRLLVALRIGAGRKEEHDVPRRRLLRSPRARARAGRRAGPRRCASAYPPRGSSPCP